MMKMLSKALIALMLPGALLCSCSDDNDDDQPKAPVTEPEFTVPANATDLSAEGTANCYILAPGTSGAFNAKYKGNSTTLEIGPAAGATLLWQTKPGLITYLNFDKTAGRIYVETDASDPQPGNALVAALDATGNILWSWHIWITDYDPANDFTTSPNANGTTWTFMDRNLGATSTDHGSFDSFGMLYQWGRKDPFPAAASFTVMNDDYTYEKDGEPTLYDLLNSPLPTIASLAAPHGSIDLSIANPTVFYTNIKKDTGETDEYGYPVQVDDWLTGDWIEIPDDDLWGGVTQAKTIYDPSPVGYKVPTCDPAGATPYEWLTYANMTWDNTGRGAEQDGQWFPATGTRVYASGTVDYPETGNPYGGLWIGTKGTEASDLQAYPTRYGQYMFIINGKRTFKVSKDRRSQGMSVRCVRE